MQTTTNATQIFGYDVLDSAGNKFGSVDNVWVDDATNELEFIGVKTGWLMGKTHVIPTSSAQINDGTITVPFSEDQVKDSPSFSGDEELSPEQEDEIYSYYGIGRSTSESPSGLPSGSSGGTYDAETSGDYQSTTQNYDTGTTGSYGDTGTETTGAAAQDDQAGMTLSEEQLQVGKREVEAGRVRLRKVVNTEHQEVPVELRREQVQIERVSASDVSTPSDAFQEGEIDVPVMREEAVVAKEAHVTGGVRLNKDVQTETRSVGGDVRKEDVEVEGDTDPNLTS